MGAVTRSLWLPIGRANFFSPMTDPELLTTKDNEPTGFCRSTRHDQPNGYLPYLRESVFRRLVEVLPTSFGYHRISSCTFSDEPADRRRPVSLTMTLEPRSARPRLAEAVAVNARLVDVGASLVSLCVDEDGFYAFEARYSDEHASTKDIEAALCDHIVALFGGDFAVQRVTLIADRRHDEGAAAVRRYNGLTDDGSPGGSPRGALSFYQLNIMLESLCNQSLLPAVFFEHYAAAAAWLSEHRRTSSILTNLNDFLSEIIVAADATTAVGQAATLHRFLVISRGSLQWMRRSVESVRRSLLDQMMAVSHRQTRLIQLNLSGVDYERTPEMTGEANESQMRGYVMLVATKLPLLCTVADCARAAVTAVSYRSGRTGSPYSMEVTEHHGDVPRQVTDLDMLVRAWSGLLEGLLVNVRSLETAVEHDWQERLLYQQEQARSEQEAMAEIERSRRGRPEIRRIGDVAYNAIMLILTAVAVFVAVQTSDESQKAGKRWWEQALDLWPVGAIGALLLLTWPAAAWLRRLMHQRKPDSDSYGLEFAFRLDERSSAKLIDRYLSEPHSTPIPSAAFGSVTLRRRGGRRVERISPDTTLLKVHSIAVARVGLFRYARFEIVSELMIRKVSGNSQHFLRQCRMFGDSPVPLAPNDVVDLLRSLLRHACAPLAENMSEADIEALVEAIGATTVESISADASVDQSAAPLAQSE